MARPACPYPFRQVSAAAGLAALQGSAISPAVRRLALELTDRLATALAGAIRETSAVTPPIARLQGITLASLYQIIISEAGQRTRDGQSQGTIVDELYPAIEDVLDEIDRWLST